MEDFNYNDDNVKKIKQALQDITVKPTYIKSKGFLSYIIPKDNSKLIDINHEKEYVNYLANLDIYVHKEKPEEAYKFELITNAVLKLKFNNMIETSNEYKFFVDKDEFLIEENKFVKTVDNASNLFYYIISGRLEKLSKTRNYNDLLPILMKVMEDNEIKGHKSIGYEILITELCRDKTSLSTPFRHVVNKQNVRGGFKTINIRETPRAQSAISALFGENIMQGLTSTINATLENKEPQLTPIEEITLNKFNK